MAEPEHDVCGVCGVRLTGWDQEDVGTESDPVWVTTLRPCGHAEVG